MSVAELRAILQAFKNDDPSTLSSLQYVLAVLLDYTYSLPVGGGITQLTGDVTAGPGAGSQAATVTGLDGNPVSAASPSPGDALVWDGTQWAPAPSGGGTINGTIAANEIAFGTGVDSIGGSAQLEWNAGTGVLTVSDPAVTPVLTVDTANAIVDFSVDELRLAGNAGAAGEVLTSQGTGLPPVWQASGSGNILPFRAGAWVDPSNPGAADDGNTSTPFVTIQGAINALQTNAQVASGGLPYTSTVQKQFQTVWVAPGIYNEDVTVPAGLAWYFVAMGGVTLGNGAGSNLVSTAPLRNWTWEINGNTEPSSVGNVQIRPTLFLTTWPAGPTSSTHPGYASGWVISGEFRMTQTGIGAFAQSTTELHLNQVKVTGNVTKNYGLLGSTGQMNCYFRHCFFDNPCDLTGGNVQVAYDTEFDSTLSFNTYCRFSECELNGNITAANFSEDLPPGGFIACKFTALTFTCPVVGSFRVDPYSNATAKAAVVTLAGGATKTIIGDTTP